MGTKTDRGRFELEPFKDFGGDPELWYQLSPYLLRTRQDDKEDLDILARAAARSGAQPHRSRY